MKVYLLLLDHSVMKLFQRLMQSFSHDIRTMKREREGICFAFFWILN
jgi:hypothetical protein